MARTVFEKSDAITLVAEVFRELGFEGASLYEITERTGLSKGSLYHFFPGGKEGMAVEILSHIEQWFVTEVFEPLEHDEPQAAIARMWEAVDAYFRSGRRVCLLGAFALDETRDRFRKPIELYFKRWIEALAGALVRGGVEKEAARELAEEIVGAIQGALTLSRALKDETVFGRTLTRLRARTDTALPRRRH
ncbi:transcriptional regulator, TetR family [Afipia carboxidovorans OM5]|uniref:Putative transcriptional regulatory protein n=1 Tax=Afipia carboxidovorans (strain ATCC 49405 / DSM 1227 / KCTC 32145 / OM5) TaxID=504832 RepID=B6JDE9_AFIC5|nr:TetR/AcrR family transcriptional regulator [Afipia carboxidovorans]ACI91861.1 transcriptional regulator, TetR family [Afipia carboxidovorans OM5]AEI04277.1 putative transcriptional regulatory protein [Afipia carboxidovorans OM4]AEI07907.1 putative transcriptional regulatory protein [Afipia carboxidovorans OM5]